MLLFLNKYCPNSVFSRLVISFTHFSSNLIETDFLPNLFYYFVDIKRSHIHASLKV